MSNPVILITGHGSNLNYGVQALLESRVQTLSEVIPNAKFIVATYYPDQENQLKTTEFVGVIAEFPSSKKEIISIKTWCLVSRILRCALWWLLRKSLHIDSQILRNESGLNTYYNAEVIISTGGDVLTEDYGTLSFLSCILNLWLGILLDKPVVLYCESIGPFKSCWNKKIAKIFLNQVRLIILREEISWENLKMLKIKTPIYVTTDSAFTLRPASEERAKEILVSEGLKQNSGLLVGISVSRIIARYGYNELKSAAEKYQSYIATMAECIDYVIGNFNAIVIFVPHVIGPSGNDDRIVANDIFCKVNNQHKVVLMEGIYSASETQAVIGQCELFFGARMHSTIASLSMTVPTIALAYSQKTYGIIGKALDYEKYIIDINNFRFQTFIPVFEAAWNNRKAIKAELIVKIPDIEQRALVSAKLVKDIIASL